MKKQIYMGLIGLVFGVSMLNAASPDSFRSFSVTQFQIQEDYLYTNLDPHVLEEGAINGMLDTLNDPYTYYIPPGETDNSIQTVDYGVGISLIRNKNDQVEIDRVQYGTPAHVVGIRPGDVVVSVNGVIVKALTLKEVKGLLVGPVGSKVELKIYKPLSQNLVTIALTREIVSKMAIGYHTWFQGKIGPLYFTLPIGYVYLRNFESETLLTDFDNTMKMLMDQKIKGLIIDLRGNEGGLVGGALDLANAFLGKATICYIQDRSGKLLVKESDSNQSWPDLPVVLLVDHHTASAAEIFAAALSENRPVPLVGERTYGKAVVQKRILLPNGGTLVVANSEYLTPRKTRLSGKGLPVNVTAPTADSDLFFKKLNAHIDNGLIEALRVLLPQVK